MAQSQENGQAWLSPYNPHSEDKVSSPQRRVFWVSASQLSCAPAAHGACSSSYRSPMGSQCSGPVGLRSELSWLVLEETFCRRGELGLEDRQRQGDRKTEAERHIPPFLEAAGFPHIILPRTHGSPCCNARVHLLSLPLPSPRQLGQCWGRGTILALHPLETSPVGLQDALGGC